MRLDMSEFAKLRRVGSAAGAARRRAEPADPPDAAAAVLRRVGARLVWTDALVAWLAKAGFDARFEARPLQRALERQVVPPLAKFLLEHPDLRGGTIWVDHTDGGVTIERRLPAR